MADTESPEEPKKAAVKLQFAGVSGPIDFTKGRSANYTIAKLRIVKDGKVIDAE